MFRLPKGSNQSSSKRTGGKLKSQVLHCKYQSRSCCFLPLEYYDYCLKHILEDKSAPYKPCPFLYTVSGKKCGKPAHRLDRKDTCFCAEHSRKAYLIRQKASTRHAPPQTQEALLASLNHYGLADQSSANVKKDEESSKKRSAQAINPFVDVDAAQVNASYTQVLDCASDSDSDAELAMLDSVWRAQDHESSDAESVDSLVEDPLKHAGTYTAEEVSTIIKDKMMRLQSLYIDQFRRLHHVLKEHRRKYLHAVKKEKETMCSIHDQEKSTAKDQKLYQKLKALNHYHKYYGEEAILHKKALERRAQATEGTLVRTSHKGKCAFTEGGVKCGAKTLPATKFCRKHILEDTQQVMFRRCGFKRDDHTCQEPTLSVFENVTCVYHNTLPAQPHNSLDMSEAKTELKPVGENDKQEQETLEDSTLEAVETTNPLGDESVPVKQIESLVSDISVDKCLETSSCDIKSAELPVNSPEIVSSAPEPTSAVNVDTTLPESTSEVPSKSVDEKMDIDEVVQPKVEEVVKDESSPDELVMVDMITDVGVVEEVLESEVKVEAEECVQIDSGNDNVPENGENKDPL